MADAEAPNAPSAQDTLRILISTDNHLGYAERDPVRGEDSFRTFQEILQLARRERVDMLLLAGDLFHENKPSRKTMYQTMALLRAHCMGDDAVRFQIVSDQSINFPNFGTVNYEDPNYNVALPVFSIHGNHDDPSREAGGAGRAAQQPLAALDLLSAANLVNYFGKSEKADAIEVFPILMVKGATRVAIYGMGNMRDERLNRMFAQQHVVFRRPAEHAEDWFSLFVVHQNRDAGRGNKNCLRESFVPDFVDFVVWGHEHECRVEPQESVHGQFFISQPGSSVATSLVEGEAKPKHVALLELNQQSFRMSTRLLKTVRPFKMANVVLSEVESLDPNDPDISDRIHELLEQKVLDMLDEAADEIRSLPQELQQILVRVRVEHTGFPVLFNQRFGTRFVGRVANPNDILLFHKSKKNEAMKSGKSSTNGLQDVLLDPIAPTRLDTATIEDFLRQELHSSDQKLVFLPEASLANALEEYIVKNIPSALQDLVENVLEQTQRELVSKKDTQSLQDIVSAVETRVDKQNADGLLAQQEQNARTAFSTLSQSSVRPDVSLENALDQATAALSRSSVATQRFGAPRRPVREPVDDDEEDEESDHTPAKTKTKRKAMAARAAASQNPTKSRPVRAAATAAASKVKRRARRDAFSDDDEEVDSVSEDNDADEDFAMEDVNEEDEDDEASIEQRVTPKKRKATAATNAKAKTTAFKRLKNVTRSSDDETATTDGAPSSAFSSTWRRNRETTTAPASDRTSAQGHVDLCSSSESDFAPTSKAKPKPKPKAPPKAKAKPPAARKKPTPQPKISDIFRAQTSRQHQQELEQIDSDQDAFVPATSATHVDDETPRLEQASQSQSQAPGSARKRKLPLSLLAASQSQSQSQQPSIGGAAARKGWGRTRR